MLAMAVCQATSMLNVPTSSRACSLLQGFAYSDRSQACSLRPGACNGSSVNSRMNNPSNSDWLPIPSLA